MASSPGLLDVDPDELRAFAADARRAGASVEEVAEGGSSPAALAVGHAELAAAIGDLRGESRRRIRAVSTQMSEVGEFLSAQADSWEALDTVLDGALAGALGIVGGGRP